MRKEFHDRVVGDFDIRRIARQRDPTKRSATRAKLWTNVRGHKSGKGKRVGVSMIKRALANVVAVVKHFGATLLKAHHQAHMLIHRVQRKCLILLRIGRPQRIGITASHVGGVVAFEWIVRAGLISQRVRNDVARVQTTQQFHRVSQPTD